MDSGLGSVTRLVGQASQFRSQFGQFHQRSEVTSLPRPARSAGFWSVGTYLHSVISLASIFRTWLRTDGIFRCSESSVTQRCCRDSRPSWKRGSIPVHLVYCWPDRLPCAPLSVQASGLSGSVLRVLSLQPDLCCAGPTACVSKRVYNRLQNSWHTLQIFGIFLMNFALQLKKYTVSQITPRPPNQCWSLFPVLWSFRAWSTLCRGEGGCFTWYLNTRKFAVKCISSVLQAIVAPLPRSALDNGLSSSWSPNVQVGLARISRTSKPRFSVGGVPGWLQPSRLSIEKLSVLRGPHVILCLTGRKCALSWPVSLYCLQFPRLEWWRWGCLLPCPSPCIVVCIHSQGLGWSRVWHKWSMLAGVWAFARALVRSNATCAASRHPRTWKWRRSSIFPTSSNGMENRWSVRQHTSLVESLWRSLGVAHSSSLRAARGHFPSGMERRARGQIPLCWTLALEFPSCLGHAANGTCDTHFLPDSTLQGSLA